MENNTKHLLEVTDLYTSFNIPAGEVRSVNGISFTLDKGKVLGIVGESGSGKSVTAYSIMQILQNPGRIVSGSIKFNGKELIGLPHHQLQKIRGDKIAIIFQDPMSSLNPVYTIGNQIREAINLHPNPVVQKELTDNIKKAKINLEKAIEEDKKKSTKESKILISTCKDKLKSAQYKHANYAQDRALEMLRLVGINEPEKRLKQYPFEFSGGMLQRIMIAMALVCDPDLLIADEPTTALDVTIQAQILELLKSIQEKMGMGIIIITHDLGVVAQICDQVNVMYAGRIVEKGNVNDIFYHPKHEYTKGLMNSIPQANDTRERLIPIKGNPVDVFCLPEGCSFAPRCDSCMKVCLQRYPKYQQVNAHHSTACFKYTLEAFKKGLIKEREVNAIVHASSLGNAAFTPISHTDVVDALNDYKLAKKQNMLAQKDESISVEEKEKLEFKEKAAKANYKRSKHDLKIANKNRAYARKERPITEKIDTNKKIKEAKKRIRNSDDINMNKRIFFAFLRDLNISSFPVDFHIHRENVWKAKEKVELHKSFTKGLDKNDKITCSKVLSDLDKAINEYDNVYTNYIRKKTVEKRLAKARKQLIEINARRVIKAIKKTAREDIKEFEGKNLRFSTEQEMEQFLLNHKLTKWEIDLKLDEARVIQNKRNVDNQLRKLRSLRAEHAMRSQINEAIVYLEALRLQHYYTKGEYKICCYYKRIKEIYDDSVRKITKANLNKSHVIYREGGAKE